MQLMCLSSHFVDLHNLMYHGEEKLSSIKTAIASCFYDVGLSWRRRRFFITCNGR